MEKSDCISVRIISANSNNGDPECNLHFSIVIKHHSGCCTIKNENHLILQFWVTFDKLASTHQENDQLEVESTCMQPGEEEHRGTPEFWQFSVHCRAVPGFLGIVTAGFVKLLEPTYRERPSSSYFHFVQNFKHQPGKIEMWIIKKYYAHFF